MTGYVVRAGWPNQLLYFLVVSSTDHITGVPGLTLSTLTLVMFNNSLTAIHPTGTLYDFGHGIYAYATVAGDCANVGPLWLHAEASGCDPTDACYQVVAYDPTNAANLGLTNLDATISSRSTYSGGADVWQTAVPGPYPVGTAGATLGIIAGLVLAPNYNQFSALALALAPGGGGGGTDPWATPLPGSYAAGTAGNLLGSRLDVAVSTRSTYAGGPVASVTAPVTVGGYSGAGVPADPWATALPGSYAAGTAGRLLGAQADPWATALPGNYAAGTAGNIVGGRLDVAVSTRSTYAGGPVASVTAPVTVGGYSGAGIPADPWGTLVPGAYAAGTAGYILGSRLDVNVSTRSTYGGADTPGTTTLVGLLTPARAARLDNLDVAVSTRSTYAGGAVASVTGAVGSVTAPVIVGGYAAGAAPVDPWTIALPGAYAAGTAGAILGGRLDVAVSTRSTYDGTSAGQALALLAGLVATGDPTQFTAHALATAPGGGGSGTDPWTTPLPGSYAPGTAGAILAILPGLVSTSDATQFTAHALAAAPAGSGGGVSDPWSIALPGAYLPGTAGAIVGGRLDVAVSTRSTYAGADTAGTTTLLGLLTPARAANLDNLDVAVSTRSTYAGVDTPGTTTLLTLVTPARAGNLDNLDVAVSTRSTYAGGPVASVTAPVTVGGYAAGMAPADAWATALPGSYAAGTAGYIVGMQLDAAVSSRSVYAGGPVASVTAPVTVGGYSGSGIPADPWNSLLPGSYGAGTAGNILGSRLDAAVSTRSTYAGGPVASVAGAVGSVTAPVIVGGYAAGAAPVDPWTLTVPGSYLAGTAGYILGSRLDVAVSTRSIYAGGDTPGTAALAALLTPARAANLDFLDVAVSTRSTYAGGAVASVTAPVTVAAIQDKQGYSLAATGLDAVSAAPPAGVAATFREMVVATWRRFYMSGVKDPDTGTIRTYADDGVTVLTTQDYVEDTTGAESMGPSR